jgi:hypothetical protein
MLKSLFVLLMLQSTAAFATTQVLQCKGLETDDLGEFKKPISVLIKIVRPVVQSLLVINGEEAASERAYIQVYGQPEIQVNGINVTHLRKSINISGYAKDLFSISAFVPVQSIGVTSEVAVSLSRVTSDNVHLRSNLICSSTLENRL